MPSDPPIPAEREALDRPWRIWASLAVSAFVLLSLGLGFVLLPVSEEAEFDPFASICRALGIPGATSTAEPAGKSSSARPASRIVWSSTSRKHIHNANSARGAAIATEVCAACHGENGIAPDPAFPNVANQPATALFKQLQDYKTGSRQGGQAEVMALAVEPLDEQQLADVAAHFASLDPQPRLPAASAVMRPMMLLATMGDPARGLAACDSCHGASGAPEGTPKLLGQSVPYLEQQLQLFASGERNNDLFRRMRVIAGQLTQEEIRALALYYGGLAVPQYKN